MTTASITTEKTEALRLTKRINRIEPSATTAMVAETSMRWMRSVSIFLASATVLITTPPFS